MKFGKRQILLASLILVLGAAVYLNWQFSGVKNDLAATEVVNDSATEKQLGQAQFVNLNSVADTSSNTSSDNNSSGDIKQTDTPVTSNVSSDTSSDNNSSNSGNKKAEDYFAQAKLNRQKAQDDAVEMVKDILEDATASETAKSEAVAQASKIANIIQQQSNVESLIKAKGFSDCLVFIQNSECSVVVSGVSLDDTLAITIKDIVTGQTGISADKVKITEV